MVPKNEASFFSKPTLKQLQKEQQFRGGGSTEAQVTFESVCAELVLPLDRVVPHF